MAERLLARWRELPGEGLWLEAVSYGIPGLGAGSVRLTAHTLALGDRLSIPVVLTNAVSYAHPEKSRLADVLDAARLLRPIPFGRGRLDSGERYRKDAAAMEEIAERIAAAASAAPGRGRKLLEETVRTAEQCRVDPVRHLGVGRPHFPEPQVVGAGGKPGDGMRLLRQRCEAGMVARGLDTDTRAMEQLEYELDVIGQLKYEAYFLAVAHAVAEIRRTTGRQLDLDSPDHVDLADRDIFELIRRGHVLGRFQIESPGQQDLIARLQLRFSRLRDVS